jgi:carbonic anhydrase
MEKLIVKNKSSIARRKLLQYGTIALGTGALTQLTGKIGNSVQATEIDLLPEANKTDLTPDEAFNLLLEGNKRFISNKRLHPHQDFARIREVAKDQFPFAAILSCADSRIPVEIIFDQGLGDIFVVRDAGNIATPEEIGSLEFGSAILGAKVLIVMGHQDCGAVKATIAGKPVPGQIASIIDAIVPALQPGDKNSKEYLVDTIKRNVLLQIEKLKRSPVLSQLVAENKLKIAGGYYNLDTAEFQLIT